MGNSPICFTYCCGYFCTLSHLILITTQFSDWETEAQRPHYSSEIRDQLLFVFFPLMVPHQPSQDTIGKKWKMEKYFDNQMTNTLCRLLLRYIFRGALLTTLSETILSRFCSLRRALFCPSTYHSLTFILRSLPPTQTKQRGPWRQCLCHIPSFVPSSQSSPLLQYILELDKLFVGWMNI